MSDGTRVLTDDGDQRDRDTTAGTLEALLHAITNRLTEVTIAKVKGRQGRKGTRHWTPAAGEPMSTKALDPATVVDPQAWRDQVQRAAIQVLGPAGAQAGARLRQQLIDAGVQPPPTTEAPVAEQPPQDAIPPQPPPGAGGGGGGPDGPEVHPIRDYAIIRAVKWLADAGESKAHELRGKIAQAEQAEAEKQQQTAHAMDVVRAQAAREGATVEPIVTAIRGWQAGPDGDTGLASWARTRAEAATTATVQGVRHGLLANLPPHVTVTRTWQTRRDDRVRDAHRLAEGQTVNGDDPFIVGGEPLRYPGDPAGSPGNVINCFPGDTLVRAVGVEASYKRWYSGPVVRIRTASDRVVTATPNHPLLTDRGWVTAGALNVGDNLIGAAVRDPVVEPLVDPDVQDPPARIEQVHRALSLTGHRAGMRGRPVDFHGDGSHGEVDVVWADGMLPQSLDTASGEHGSEFILPVADVVPGTLTADRTAVELVGAGTAPAAGSVRGGGDLTPLVGCHPRETRSQGGCRVTDLDTRITKHPIDDVAGYPEPSREDVAALASEVAPDEIVSVDVEGYSGHVYNLQTGSGIYLAGGIVTHNCRCDAPYHVEVPPETKDLVRTPEGAEHYGVPIGSVIEAHRKPTVERPYALAGNVEAVGWGYAREESLAAAMPFMLGGLGDRDENGQRQPSPHDEAPDSFLVMPNHDETVQAKQQVAADLAGRMTSVSDADLIGEDAEYASDPTVVWRRNQSSGEWQPDLHTKPSALTDPDLTPAQREAVAARTDIDVGGPDMVRRMREQAVSDLVHQWAETSNDHSAQSLAMQQVIAEEFDIPDAHEWPVDEDTQSEIDAIMQTDRPKLAGFVHAQYQATQERLEQAGIDTIDLYRGMSWPSMDEVPDWARGIEGNVDSVTVPLRPASSFTADAMTASSYGQGTFEGTLGEPGAPDEFDGLPPSLVLAASVPRERIFSTARTGVGCLGEWEFVVLGGDGTLSAVGQNLGGDEEPLSDHDLGWMPVRGFDDNEVLRALTLKPTDARRRELLKRADDLGIQIKALPTDPPADPPAQVSAADVENEDWIKTRSWDLRDWNEQPITTLPVLAARLGTDEAGAAEWLRTMPAGKAAPKSLRRAKPETKALPFDPAKHPRGVGGRWAHIATLTTEDYEGRVGDKQHITRIQRGTLPTAEVADLPGARGEVPGAHVNRQGDRWKAFVEDVRDNGIHNPIFITVDHGEGPKISEGNHRRDAAVELGHPEVPVEIRYYGHAEQDKPGATQHPLVEGKPVTAGDKVFVWHDTGIGVQQMPAEVVRVNPTTVTVKWKRTGVTTRLPRGRIDGRIPDDEWAEYEGKSGMSEDLETKAVAEAVRGPRLAGETLVEFDRRHPRGVHGRFSHVWVHIMKSHATRDPSQVVGDVIGAKGDTGADAPTIKWRRHLDGSVSEDGRYYIERRIAGNRLYVRADKADTVAEAVSDGPFPYGKLVDTGSIGDLRTSAEAHDRALHSDQGGTDEQPVRSDGGSQLAEGRPGGVRGDQGQAGVLPGDRGRGAAPDRHGDGRPGPGGGDVHGAGDAAVAGAGAGGGDRGPGAPSPAADRPADRVAGSVERDSAAGPGEPGGRGVPAGDDRLSGRGDGAGAAEPGDDLVTEQDQPEADPSALPGAIGGEDFTPTSMDDLAPAGQVAKLNANMAALRLLRQLQAEKRPATPEEQQVLARWAGWGGLPDVFDPRKPRFADERAELEHLLSPAEIWEARRNTLNAHYTDARVVENVWRAVGELGFDGGRVLEPGSGSGTFIGFAPEHAAMVGVELDSTTAAISQYLYPSAQIRNESFADTNVPDGSFDATVGNVPFGNFALTDREHNPTGESIHNHFILKSLALTRPGGIVAVLTSRYTLDSQNDRARRLMADRADLIGAVRLPTGSHQRASGTDVIEDVLIFRVREPGQAPQADQSWVHSTKQDIDGQSIPVSDYWAQHPENVLGEVHAEKGRYGTGDMIVRGDRDMTDLPAVMDGIVASAKRDGLTATPSQREALPDLITSGASRRHEGHIRAEKDGTFTQAVGGASRPLAVPGKQADELRSLLGLRDGLRSLLDAEAKDATDSPQIAALRDALNARYDAYVSEYGPINRFKRSKSGARNRPAQGGFRSDPQSAIVRALEEYDPESGTGKKADVFTQRAVAPRKLRTAADTPADALTLSMEQYGDVNMPAIAKMLGTDEATARQQLGDLVFEQPPLTDAEQAAAEAAQTAERLGDLNAADDVDLTSVGESVRDAGKIEPAAAYLSGNVRRKLAAARAAATHDPRFQTNVDALQRVLPADLGPEEIDGRLGASWIGPDTVEAFIREILNERVPSYGRANQKVQVAHSGGSIWTVVAPRQGILSTQEWGTPDRPAPELIHALLEQRPIKVTREVTMPDGSTKNVPDLEATLAAQEKADEIQQRFSEWLWENPDRARQMAATYNDLFNSIVLRKYDAAPDRQFEGMSEAWQAKILQHVKSAGERITQEPTVLLAHVVGAGKTAEMSIGTQELRRLGLARKPAIVIPNHMLEQFSREYLEIYPQAKILAAGTQDLAGEKRREFVARAATGDWDCVILTQSAFEAIPMSPESTQAYIDREMAVMRDQLEKAEADPNMSNAQKRTVKKMENALLRAEEALKKKLGKNKDAGVSFEQTGIDYLMVDEAHMYSNLRTLSNISAANIAGSDRATDLHMKIEHLREHSPSGRVATFATGTPIRNTVTQAYVMMRFLRPDLLEEAGIHTFDQWAGTFGQVVEELELKPEGSGFRQSSRFARFRNVPELLRIFHAFSDVKMAEDLDLKTPNLVGGGETVVVPASDAQHQYLRDLAERADKVRSREVDPTEDNMLKISGDGRKAALAMRMVGGDPEPGKIDVAADRIASIHAANKDKVYTSGPDDTPDERTGALQIVFLDMGTPKDASKGKDADEEFGGRALMADDESDWSAYQALKDELIARGVPAEQIAFIHDAKNDAEKADLFAAARNGRIQVLLGSSDKMGVGTNIQKRAIALHHLDAPWRPADVEQREGRILRQGNANPDVQVIRYVTEPSFDAYMWQTLERKAKFIHQIMRGNLDVREIDDIGDQAMSYAEVKALATGNPDLLDKAKTDTALAKLERLERAHGRQQTNMRSELKRYEQAMPQWEADAGALDEAIAKRKDTRGDAFVMSVQGEPFATRTEAADAMVKALSDMNEQRGWSYQPAPEVIGQIGGHTVVASIGYDTRTHARVLQVGFAGVPGDVFEVAPSKLEGMGTGLVTRLENGLVALDARRDRLRTALETGADETARIHARLGQDFPRGHELDALRAKSKRIAEKMDRDEKRAAGHDIPFDPMIDSDKYDAPFLREAA